MQSPIAICALAGAVRRKYDLPEYHSPNQEPASNRMMLVILFTFIFLIGFQSIYSKDGPRSPSLCSSKHSSSRLQFQPLR